MGMTDGVIKGYIVCDHPWFKIMDEGMDAPEVTGGMINLPQGGQRKSKAAVVGGTYSEGSEVGSMITEESMNLINASAQEDIRGIISDVGFDNAPQAIAEYGDTFCTNIVKSRVRIAKGEMDNKDELKAADEVEDSIKFVFEVESMPTTEDIKNYVTEKIKEAFGGGSQ